MANETQMRGSFFSSAKTLHVTGPRAFADSDAACSAGTFGGWRTWELLLPPHHRLAGLDVRVQHHYGIVDMLPRVRRLTLPPALPPLLPSSRMDDEAATVWEVVPTPGAAPASPGAGGHARGEH